MLGGRTGDIRPLRGKVIRHPGIIATLSIFTSDDYALSRHIEGAVEGDEVLKCVVCE